MSVMALSFLEDETPRDLRRWAFAAFVVLAVHLGAIGVYLYQREPDDIGDIAPVSVELAPPDSIEQPEVAPVPEEQQKEEEQPPPQAPVVAAPEPKPVEEVKQDKPPTPAMPARQKGGTLNPVAASWQTELFKRLQSVKRYPGEAQEHGQEGTVLLGFTINRNGRVLARHIAHTSGYPALDAEVMSMIDRAQPLPAFPPSMTEDTLDLTVPIRFSLK